MRWERFAHWEVVGRMGKTTIGGTRSCNTGLVKPIQISLVVMVSRAQPADHEAAK